VTQQAIDDKQLVLGLQAGAKARIDAVQTVYRQYSQPMRHFFQRQGVAAPVAEDLFQETMIKLLRHIDDFRGDGSFSAWLWRIARNELKMYWRAAARREDDTDPETLAKMCRVSDDDDRATAELVDCVRDALAQFERRHRDQAEVLRLIVRYGWGVAEVASYLERKAGATREFLSQARKKLAPLIQPCLQLLPNGKPE